MRIYLSIIVLVVGMTVMWGQSAQTSLTLEPAFPHLSFTNPVDLQHPGDQSNRLFVVEQAGVIRVFDNDPAVASAQVFLDIQSRVTDVGEGGLLGLAFHPDFASNGFFYVYYTASPPLHSVIARYEVDPTNPDRGDPDSEMIVLEVEQPFPNHNAGQLAFGPDDGYLYIALGDGGDSGDPGENGQNSGTLLGSLLRLDVDAGANKQRGILAPDCGAGENATYTIPADNPLADGPGNACDEIWAYGLRNPWRFSFDTETDRLWTADVGQGRYEEIDLIEPGGNYGWNTMEGAHCFDPPMGCDQTGLTLPVWEYEHGGQSKSVTGGFVYRGPTVPSLLSQYIYADFIDGRIWALAYEGTSAVNTLLLDTNLNPSAFGVDDNKELYLVDYGGTIYRFTPEMPVTRYVALTGNDTDNDCTDEMSPCLTIGHAATQANPDDTLHIAPGTYPEPNLVIDKHLIVTGQGVVIR
ncbi:MAG TPA: PQQ-dependent sugar dehydrogenase [Rhodothermales bacterium]|nr:PQQ-dependent sugar dehydrogenase [Rhodothermales bacterium]